MIENNKKFELIWGVIQIVFGIMLTFVGLALYPVVIFILMGGILLFLLGVVNIFKNIK